QDVCLLMLKDPDGNFVEIIGPLTKKLQQVK
ncbi:MAG: VOC family protein, partial [Verrucomicrobia bacterium]|nr:VOC family protein [Verrucomicrobiota bacterium]